MKNRSLLIIGLAGLTGAACQDGPVTGPPLAAGPASTMEYGTGERPSCHGLPATLWVGMDPTLIPPGASIVEAEHEEEGDPSHDPALSDTAHDEGGCSCDDADTHARFILTGTDGPDVIVGSSNPDRIFALNGDDVVCAFQAADEIYGGNGGDRIYAGAGADRVHGENGDDTLEGGPGRDRLWGGAGNDLILGGPGRDDLFGEAGDDILLGGMGPDALDGGPGINTLDPGPQECDGGHEGGEGGCGGHEDGGCSGP